MDQTPKSLNKALHDYVITLNGLTAKTVGNPTFDSVLETYGRLLVMKERVGHVNPLFPPVAAGVHRVLVRDLIYSTDNGFIRELLEADPVFAGAEEL